MGEVIFDAFVSDPLQSDVDLDVFKNWLKGHTADEVFLQRKKDLFSHYVTRENARKPGSGEREIDPDRQEEYAQAFQEQMGRLIQCSERDVEDQFRTFALLEHYLKRPSLLARHCCFQLSRSLQRTMVNGYYEFDELFMRSIMGQKLSHQTRGQIMISSAKSGISVICGLRQFENLRRAYRARTAKEGEEGAFDFFDEVEEVVLTTNEKAEDKDKDKDRDSGRLVRRGSHSSRSPSPHPQPHHPASASSASPHNSLPSPSLRSSSRSPSP